MEDFSENHGGADPAELLHSFRWTQALAEKLVHDPAAAADLSQEAWALAVQRFGNKLPGQAWLQGTIRSIAFRTRRSHKRRRRYEAERAEPRFADGAAEVLMRSEAQQRVAQAVDELPMGLRIAVLLRFQEGLSIAAIAERLGCPTSTASDRVKRGLTQLRRDLGSDAGDWHTCLALAGPLCSVPTPVPGAASAQAVLWLPPLLTGLAVKKLVLVGALVAAALLGLGVHLAIGVAAGPEATLEKVSRHSLHELAPTNQGALGPSALDPLPLDRRKEKGAALVPATEPSDFVFTASVVDQQGRPVPKPRMIASTETQRWEAVGTEFGTVELRLREEHLRQTIGEDMEVRLVGGRYQTLWIDYVEANGTSEIPPPYPGGHGDYGTITLSPAGAIRGLATSPGGEPIAGAKVYICRYNPATPKRYYGYSGPAPEVLTDQDGGFLMGHILPGNFLLEVRHPDYTEGSPTFKVTVVEGVTVGPVLLTASPAPAITGRVLDRSGHPIEGVRLNTTDRWQPPDTVRTGPDGTFQIPMRRGSPAKVWTSFPGWRQVSPAVEERFGPCELTIVMEPILPAAEFAVRVACAETQENLYHVGVSVVTDPETEEAAILRAAASPFDVAVQPISGLPVDFVPGRDRLLLQARGFQPKVVSTEEVQGSAPHITAMLEPIPGIRGRLLENGRPVSGARVFLECVRALKAHPGEFLRGGEAYRSDPEQLAPSLALKFRGAGRESVLGLDGNPPAYRHTTVAREGGAHTDDQGAFEIRGTEAPILALVLRRPGRADRVLRMVHVESRSMDLGDIEVAPAATLSGRFEFSGTWSPDELTVAIGDPAREVPIGKDGSFSMQGLQPGHTYFSLSYAGPASRSGGRGSGSMPFEEPPVFQVHLAPAESRQVLISLDPYAPATFDLEVVIGGQPAPDNCGLVIAPVDRPDRHFHPTCTVESGRMRGSTWSLGPCRASMFYTAQRGGWIELPCPGRALELGAGQSERRRIDIPAGWLQVTMQSRHPAAQFGELTLTLEGGASPLKVDGIQFDQVDPGATTRTLLTAPIPAGVYRATLRPWHRGSKEATGGALAEFDVTIRRDKTAAIDLR